MKQVKSVSALRPQHIFLCCLIGLVVLLSMAISQTDKLKEITRQQQELTVSYEQLQLEEQRLSRMLEYAQTDEYLEQYAREKLGYVGPDDYKFYRDAPAQ